MNAIKTIKEYANMVKNGLLNGDKIVESLLVAATVKNKTIDADDLAEIMRRKDICAACPFNSDNAKAQGVYTSALPFTHCALCQCRIGGDDTKEFCLSCNCGAEAYNKMNPHLPQLEVKWKATRKEA